MTILQKSQTIVLERVRYLQGMVLGNPNRNTVAARAFCESKKLEKGK